MRTSILNQPDVITATFSYHAFRRPPRFIFIHILYGRRDIYKDFQRSKEREMLRKSVREFANKKIVLMAVISLRVLLREGSIRRLNGWTVDHQKLGGLISQHDDLVLFTGWKIYAVARFQLLFLTTHFHLDSALK